MQHVQHEQTPACVRGQRREVWRARSSLRGVFVRACVFVCMRGARVRERVVRVWGRLTRRFRLAGTALCVRYSSTVRT